MISRRIAMEVPTTTFQDKRIRKAGKRSFIAKSDRALEAMGAFEAALLSKGNPPWSPVSIPVEVRVSFSWYRPKSHPKRLREEWAFRDSKPDADNLIKGFLDCLVSTGFISRDELVVRVESEKLWSPDERGFAGVSFEIHPPGTIDLPRFLRNELPNRE